MNAYYKPAYGLVTAEFMDANEPFSVPLWYSHGFRVLNHAIHRQVAPNDSQLIKVWQFNYIFTIQFYQNYC